jgi:DNA-binding response OmpR family regulator
VSTRPRRVLVVEDSLDSLHSLVVLLRGEGHQVEFAINGYAAITVAKKFRPEVVLLDLGLPGLSGFDVCSRLKSEPEFEGIRIIAVTAYGSEEYRVRSRAVGCDLHVVKPYDPGQLLSMVASS